jgi:hypothetical protein
VTVHGDTRPASESGSDASTEAEGTAVELGRRARVIWSAAIFVVTLAVYLANGGVLIGNDAKSNAFIPVSLLEQGNLSFTPQEAPFMFSWVVRDRNGQLHPVQVPAWHRDIGGVPAADLADRGALRLVGPKYYLATSRFDGVYVGTYGPGAGLTALPFVAIADMFQDASFYRDPAPLWVAVKLAAATMIAASAVLLFLMAQRYVGWRGAFWVTVAYAFGTAVWSISSQTLWQHGPAEFFVMIGLFCLSRLAADRRYAILCGLALAAAVVCRPTTAPLVVTVGIYLLLADRPSLWRFVLGGLPFAVFLFAYNTYYFGAPWDFGQLASGAAVAEQKTGSENVWQIEIWRNAAGLLISPSRGLLIYSPVMAFAFWGAMLLWRDDRLAWLKPVPAAVLLMWLIAFGWFSWWGGWTFAYRPIVDTMPLLAVLLIPAIDAMRDRRYLLRWVFGTLLVWSIGVQVIGAFAYDVIGWNARVAVLLPGETTPRPTFGLADAQMFRRLYGKEVKVLRLDIDKPEFRNRLWSITDSPIVYYVMNFARTRERKQRMVNEWTRNPAQ